MVIIGLSLGASGQHMRLFASVLNTAALLTVHGRAVVLAVVDSGMSSSDVLPADGPLAKVVLIADVARLGARLSVAIAVGVIAPDVGPVLAGIRTAPIRPSELPRPATVRVVVVGVPVGVAGFVVVGLPVGVAGFVVVLTPASINA